MSGAISQAQARRWRKRALAAEAAVAVTCDHKFNIRFYAAPPAPEVPR